MPDHIWAYLYLVTAAGASGALVLMVYGLVKLWAPSAPSEVKRSTYECGIPPVGEPWVRFHLQYYLFALLFLIFDVETVFAIPWVVVYRRLGWAGWWDMVVFVAVILIGLVYAMKKRVLRWV